MSQKNKDLDIVVFGATGFTGQFVVEQICYTAKQQPGLKWAISGRSKERLQEVFTIVSTTGGGNILQPEVLVANVENPDTLNVLAKRAKVLIDCVGPFRFFGEPIVKACVENCCDYVDITGETEFIERMLLTYDQPAKANGVTIVHACGYDSIPADLGVLFTKHQLEMRGAIPSQVEMFSGFKSGQSGFCINYGTYTSLVHSISNINMLRELRKHTNRPAVPTVGTAIRKLPSGKWDERVHGYIIPSFLSDPSVIRLSQQLDIEHNTEVLPTQLAAYIVFSSYRSLLMLKIGGAMFGFLTKFSWGRSLLLKHPKLFSFGLFSHHGPTLEQIQQTGFYHKIYARGISKSRLFNDDSSLISDNSQSVKNLQPDIEIVVEIIGPEPGYVTTPISIVQCAYTLLKERTKIPKGVLTPAVAFGKTSLFQNLIDNGIVFRVLEGHYDH